MKCQFSVGHSSCQWCVNQKLAPGYRWKHGVGNFGPDDTGRLSLLRSIHLSQSAGVTPVLWKTLKVENKEKHVRLSLARSRLHLFEEHRQCIPAGLIAGCVTFGTLFYLILSKSVKIQRYQHFREMSRSGTSVLHVRNLPSEAVLYKNSTTALTLFQRNLKLFGFGWFLFRG